MQCKTCRSTRMKQWYADNQERQRDRQRVRYVSNGDAIRAQDNARYERNREDRIALALVARHVRRARLAAAGYDPTVTREALRARDGDQCCYCLVVMDFQRAPGRKHPPLQATIEHVVPVSRGGAHTFENTKLACWACNSRKHSRSLEEWRGHGRGAQGRADGAPDPTSLPAAGSG